MAAARVSESTAASAFCLPVRRTYLSTLCDDLKRQSGGLPVSRPQRDGALCSSAPPCLRPFFEDHQDAVPSSPSSPTVGDLRMVTRLILSHCKMGLKHLTPPAPSYPVWPPLHFPLLQELCPSLDDLFSPLSAASSETAASSADDKV